MNTGPNGPGPALVWAAITQINVLNGRVCTVSVVVLENSRKV